MAEELRKEYLDMIPEFRGEPSILPRFIEVAEKLLFKFFDKKNKTFQNDYLLFSLRAKIVGAAAEIVDNSNVSTWNDLKEALLNAYSDKRDGYTLTIEMSSLRQSPTESPFDYYNKIQKLLNLQISYWRNHCSETATVLNEHSRKLALRVLLKGLREPIGSLMRTKNPSDLNDALNMLTNDFQFHNYNQTQTSMMKPTPPVTTTQQLMYKPTFTPSRKPILNQNKPFQYKPPMSTHTNKFTGQYRQTFAPNNAYKPTPMSISTNNTTPQIYERRPNNQFDNLEDPDEIPIEYTPDTNEINNEDQYTEANNPQTSGNQDHSFFRRKCLGTSEFELNMKETDNCDEIINDFFKENPEVGSTILSQNPNLDSESRVVHSEDLINDLMDDEEDDDVTIHSNNNVTPTPTKPFQILHIDIDNHKEKPKLLYKRINELSQRKKENTIRKRNENREPVPNIQETVYVANKQKQSKTKNKFNKKSVKSINPQRKTTNIITTHSNTKEKIHLSNIKRPRKVIHDFQNVAGPSRIPEAQK